MNDLIGMKPHWINTKVEFIWDGSQYVEQSVEGYWYEGEITFCANYDSSHTGAVIDAAVTKATPTSLGTSEVSKCVTVDASGDLIVPDSDEFKFGTGGDMKLYHDGSNSFIQQSGTGALKIATEDSAKAISIGHTTSETTVNDNLTVTGDLTMTAGDIKMDGSAGQGIDFSGSQGAADAGSMTSEVLDSYEEGTWTAVFTDFTTPLTIDGAHDTGYYTKVGNLVTVSGYFITTSLNGLTSQVIYITGLPFTVANNNAAISGGGAAGGAGFDITAGESVSLVCTKNDTYIALKVWNVTTGQSHMTAAEWSADGKIQFGFSYRAA